MLFSANRTDYWQLVINYFKQTLTCLHPITARSGLKQIEYLLPSAAANKRDNLLALLVEYGIHSIFPGVRDISFTLLLKNLDSLDEQNKDSVLDRINYDYSDYNIFWKGDFPYITEDYQLFPDHDENKGIDWEALHERLNTNTYSVHDLWRLLNASHQDERKITKVNAIRVLSAEESFVRARFVTLNFSDTRLFNNRLIEQVFQDDHPSVVFAAVTQSLIYYPNFDDIHKTKIRVHLSEAFRNQYVLIRSNNLITTFGIDYGSESIDWGNIPEKEKPEIWTLWSLLICAFFANASPQIYISNEGRFFVTIEKAKEYLNTTQGINIAEAYFFYYQKFIKGFSIPSMLASPVQLAIMLTEPEPNIRGDLFDRIFLQKSTPFILDNLATAIDCWDILSPREKTVIKELLCKEDVCKTYYAVCVTRRKVPAEIQKLILKDEFFLDKTAENVFHEIERPLFEDCIKISFGIPEVYSSLGLTNEGSLLWTNLLKEILKNPNDKLFGIATETMIYNMINTPTEHWRKGGIEIWRQMCEEGNLEQLLQTLIEATVIVNFSVSDAAALWKVIENRYDVLERKEFLVSQIMDNIYSLQTHMDAYDFFEVFSKELSQLIIKKSHIDNTILSICDGMLKKKIKKEGYEDAINSIIASAKEQPLKLKITFSWINQVIEKLNLSQQQQNDLKNIPDTINDRGKSKSQIIKDKFYGATHYIPSEWRSAE